ncbi:MAG TPA: hypothetical protein VGG80_08330 [Acidobacteriaceae bacterium]
MTCNWKFALSIFALTALPMLAGAQRLKPIPHPIRAPQGAKHVASAAKRGASGWTPLANQPAFLADGASNPILLTDGTVLIQDAGFPDWWKLTPDQNGSYIDGTWSQIASLPASYSPLYHSTAVLPDGRMIIEGGEYLLNSAQTAMVPTWTAKGAIYDPLTNIWTPVAPPAGWQSIGDAQSVVLPNGTYMQADCCATDTALLNARTLTWTPTGANKFDANDEEGWNLLPNGQVLAVDAYTSAYNPEGTNSELYDPATGTWRSAGSTIVQLWDSAADCGGEPKATFELGPAVLRPDGTVFYTGANSCGAANTSIYNTHNRSWSPGPQFPDNFSISDGPATLETNGNVLMMASPSFAPPSQFFEWNGRSLTAVANPPNAPIDLSYFGNMLVLPTGQILLTDFSNDIEIYGSQPSPGQDWAPVIVHAPRVVTPGGSYEASGLRFNGMSQGAAYGDDVQAATNYPLVRITNLASGHVFYSRTHDHSSMAVASDQIVSTHFDLPSTQEVGLSTLEVVANGIPSRAVYVFVTK